MSVTKEFEYIWEFGLLSGVAGIFCRSGTTDGWTKNASMTRMSPFIYKKAKEKSWISSSK